MTGCRLFAALGAFLCLAGLAAAKPVKFDIPAQRAGDALIAFSKQSGLDVLYAYQDLQAVRSAPVAGEFEPDEALALLLKDTGFAATRDSGKFVVARAKVAVTGSVRGALALPGGAPAAGVLVVVRDTAQSGETDRDGQFFFSAVAPGSHVLVARAEGYQPLHITDVVVKAGGELTLGRQTLHKPADGLTVLQPFVVRGEAVTELDKYSVYGSKQAPFTGANMDIPRTVNDAQAYYIFDAPTIDRSGATSVEDFLRGQLTMNTSWIRPGVGTVGGVTVTGSTNSSIDLRGIGTDKTLILVNGRRQMTTGTFGATSQPDLNLIPMALIERVEVLPSSASGIYGGSAIGGVVNVVLKRNFSGGEVRMNYGGPLDTDAPTATIGANYGFSLEGGRTQLRLGASWSDGKELTLGERRDIYLSNLDRILANSPDYFNNNTFGFASERVNITPTSLAQTTLTLKNGTVLTTPRTFVGSGISPTSSISDLSASLAGNVGKFSRGMANTNDLYNARQGLGLVPRNLNYTASVRREMTPWLEVFSDFTYVDQLFESVYNPVGMVVVTVPINAASNPFTTAVWTRIPSTTNAPMRRATLNKTLTVGGVIKLPANWTAALDYTWSASSARYAYLLSDSTAMSADLVSGVLNPFVDTVLYPISFDRYLASVNSYQTYALDDYALRANGPISVLPWGSISATLGLERCEGENGTQYIDWVYPLTPNSTIRDNYFAKGFRTDSAYAELLIPVVPRERFKFLHSLDVQVAGRTERFEADTGTTGVRNFYLRTPPTTTIVGANQNGSPVFGKVSYDSTDFTLALKYQPHPDFILRASRGTAFLPPTSAQLAPSNSPSLTPSVVVDPTTGNNVSVTTVGGGNPSLVPQNSISTNAGIVWQPRTGPLRGLRVNAEYYNIEQFDFIAAPTAQTVVSNPDVFPGRVTRNASGVITQVDISNANLYRRETDGIDFTLDYAFKTGAGQFTGRAAETIILHNFNQYSLTLPDVDSAGYPSDNGGVKRKRNLSLNWERGNWTAGWALRYVGSYYQVGKPDSPQVIRTPTLATNFRNTYLLPQGSDSIPSQSYHDVFAGYAFRRGIGRSNGKLVHLFLDGLQVQAGIRNLFNKAPPFDAYAVYNNYYASQFGDLQLRTYWVSVRKQF